ncbi:hypothetical protein DL98DRAFT_300526 [Cadophora sp. DSE1049]|nr:hypothetical protein DL98DRAFT_300526 [Cadophora sp. DSE1049]
MMASSQYSTCATSGSSPKYITAIMSKSTLSNSFQTISFAGTAKPTNQSSPVSPSTKQSVPTSKPSVYSISRYKSDPIFSQPEFRFNSQSKSIQANENRASTVCSNFDKVFYGGDDSCSNARSLESACEREDNN